MHIVQFLFQSNVFILLLWSLAKPFLFHLHDAIIRISVSFYLYCIFIYDVNLILDIQWWRHHLMFWFNIILAQLYFYSILVIYKSVRVNVFILIPFMQCVVSKTWWYLWEHPWPLSLLNLSFEISQWSLSVLLQS